MGFVEEEEEGVLKFPGEDILRTNMFVKWPEAESSTVNLSSS